jgi:hypothetical protein
MAQSSVLPGHQHAEARRVVGEDLERKRRISELLYQVIQANRRKAKYGNGKPPK